MGKLVKIVAFSLMSPVGPGNATLNDEEVNIAIHTITRNLPMYQNLRLQEADEINYTCCQLQYYAQF